MSHQTALESPTELFLPVRHYNLAATLSSGQAFRWNENSGGGWSGVVGKHWVRLCEEPAGIRAFTVVPVPGWDWLKQYLQIGVNIQTILDAFPDDLHMRKAMKACHGLRILRQDPWECLASFILSSTKQIVQIRQIVELLCTRYGERVTGPISSEPVYSFPSADRLAECSEAELRSCKMGFRAGRLLTAAKKVSSMQLVLDDIGRVPFDEALCRLTELDGVGPKIARCVLLFAYDFPQSFPVDVWIRRTLRQLYFPRRKMSERDTERFIERYFGPYAGYAQQYLFHYARTRVGKD